MISIEIVGFSGPLPIHSNHRLNLHKRLSVKTICGVNFKNKVCFQSNKKRGVSGQYKTRFVFSFSLKRRYWSWLTTNSPMTIPRMDPAMTSCGWCLWSWTRVTDTRTENRKRLAWRRGFSDRENQKAHRTSKYSWKKALNQINMCTRFCTVEKYCL